MANGTVTCSKCFAPLPVGLLNRAELSACPACHARFVARVFPAFFKPTPKGQIGETILADGEASCFYHPSKRAVRPCDQCGRFLCSLCDLDMQGRHVCPSCLSSPRSKKIMPRLENRRVLYDSAALTLALLPILFWPITIVTAPVAIVLALYSFKKESSLIPRTRARSWLAIFFACLTIAGWVALFVAIRHN